MHIELLSYSATAPGAAGAAAAAVTGDSLIIKNAIGRDPQIIAWWARNQTAGFHQVTAPSFHDTTRGIRVNVPATEIDPRLPLGVSQDCQAQELLSCTIAGSATAGDVELGCFLLSYPNLPGVTGRYITYAQMLDKKTNLTTVSATLAGAAAGYTGAELINAESDLLRANTNYAVLGMTTNTDCAAMFISGPDTGYQKVAVPGDSADNDFTSQWFCYLARAYDDPLIPVINSGNKASTSFGFLQDENNVSPLVTLYLAQLGKPGSND